MTDQAGDPARPGYLGQPVGAFLDGLAAATAAPAGGSAAALTLALAACLCAKAARLSARTLTAERAQEMTKEAERIRTAAASLIDADALAYRAVIEATRDAASPAGPTSRPADGPVSATTPPGRGPADQPPTTAGAPAGQTFPAAGAPTGQIPPPADEPNGARRAERMAAALSHAADVPMRVVELAARTAQLAAALAADGNQALHGDAIAAALLAQSAARAAATLVSINLAAGPDDARHARSTLLLAAIARSASLATGPDSDPAL